MANDERLTAVTSFYETHPINEQQIIAKLQADGDDLTKLTEDILQKYDQDHFGGVEANDILAQLASLDDTCHLLDVCSGMGGPSRYLAHNYGCRVTGIDLTKARVDGATKLTKLAGLENRVTFQNANALALPFDDKTFDVVIGQEAFCHIPNKNQLMAECVRVLKPGGRLAFTDIIATDSTTDASRDRLQEEMAFMELGSRSAYGQQLESLGCTVTTDQDLSSDWEIILKDRLAMYRGLKDQTIDSFGSDHFTKWDNAYSFFVGSYGTGELGGNRFLAQREE